MKHARESQGSGVFGFRSETPADEASAVARIAFG
jgi:hypothetical protein